MTAPTAEQVNQLIQQNGQLISLIVKEQTNSNDPRELKTKAGKVVDDLITKTSTFHSAQYMHGPTGVFSTYGLSREIISTHIEPEGLLDVLPNFANNDTNPNFGGLTGFSDDYGSNPTYVCDDAPVGYLKACTLTAQYGQVTKSTETISFRS